MKSDFNILPLTIKVAKVAAAKTFSSELVSVKPLGFPSSSIWTLEPKKHKPKITTLNESRLKPIKL